MASVRDVSGNEVRYEWGAAGELTGLVYPDGRRVGYEHDNLGRLVRLSAGGESVSYEYDVFSRLARTCASGGLETTYNRDEMGRITGITHLDSVGVLMSLTFGYDAEGNKVRMSVRRRNLPGCDADLAYEYDALGRLIQVRQGEEVVRAYGYDAFDNRLWDEGRHGRTTYEYDAGDRLLRTVAGGRATNFSYDGRGNLRTVCRDGHVEHSYEYDATNRLVQATSAKDSCAVHYAYDGLGQRVSRQVVDPSGGKGERTSYAHDLSRTGRNLLQSSGNLGCKSLVWGGGPVLALEGGKATWFACDEAGSPLEAMGADGFPLGNVAYDEFGEVIGGDPSAFSGIGFAAYGLEPISDMLFAQAREYCPRVGRFAARDRRSGMAVVPQTLNKYSYCWNSPLAYVDMDGLWPTQQDIYNGVESTVKGFFDFASGVWSGLPISTQQGAADRLTSFLQSARSLAELDFKDIGASVAAVVGRRSEPLAQVINEASAIPSTYGLNDISDVFAALSKSPVGGQVLDFFSFERDASGVYHSKQDCWQAPFGYNDLYDFAFRGLTSAPDQPPKYIFSANGTTYTLWLWKGDYFNLGAGAESGIYRGDGFHVHSATDTNLRMKLNLYNQNGDAYFVYDPGESNWWTTGFNPNYQNVKESELIAFGAIDFSAEPGLWDGFYSKYSSRPGWCFDEKRKIAYYAWK